MREEVSILLSLGKKRPPMTPVLKKMSVQYAAAHDRTLTKRNSSVYMLILFHSLLFEGRRLPSPCFIVVRRLSHSLSYFL